MHTLALWGALAVLWLQLVSGRREHTEELLAALLESITVADQRAGKEAWLKHRTWSGKSHIGTRPQQYLEFYDHARALQPRTICEVGFNGGHSAAVFLAAAGSEARYVSFDMFAYSYSRPARDLLDRLFPGQLSYHLGNSRVTLPNYLKEQKERGLERPCDMFSVDGDHSYAGAKADLLNAINGTRVGGMLFMDDMGAEGGPRRAFDEMCKAGFVRKTSCTEMCGSTSHAWTGVIQPRCATSICRGALARSYLVLEGFGRPCRGRYEQVRRAWKPHSKARVGMNQISC